MSFWPFKKNVIPTQVEVEKQFDKELASRSRTDEGGGSGKLTSDEQLEVVRRIACFQGNTDIVKFVLESMGKRITSEAITFYKKSQKWKPLIEKFREEYNRTVLEVPLANKKKRLEELQHMYDQHKSSENFDKAQSVLRDARQEMEERVGDVSFHFTQVNNTEFKSMSDEELAREKLKALEELEKVKRITGRFNKKEITDVQITKEREEKGEEA